MQHRGVQIVHVLAKESRKEKERKGLSRARVGAGLSHTRSGLYLCGGSTHPGGNITGLCGYNAARVIAADLGKGIWWNPPDAEQALAAL